MPIRVGNKAEGEDFFDRVTEREDLWRYLAGNHILLSGPRRLGKTSLLQKMKEEAADNGLLPNLVDVEGIDNAADFVAELERCFPEKALKRFAREVQTPVRRWLANIEKAEVKLAGGVGAGIQFRPSSAMPWTAQASKLQERLSGQPVLIMIDEFSVFLEKLLERDIREGESLLGWLRAWRQVSGLSCRFIFSGSIGINSLLDAYDVGTRFNDCYDFRLGPFARSAALDMLGVELHREGWSAEKAVLEHLCERIGWRSPFYLNLLLVNSMGAGRDRELETGGTERILSISDVDDGYDRLLSSRSRFRHWYKRLQRDLSAVDFAFALAMLASVARSQKGPTRNQLMSRLQKQDAGPDRRAERLDRLMLKLEEDGYVGVSDGRIQFLSFLLRDYWKRNHA